MAQHKRRWDANPDGEEDGPPVGNAQVLPVAQLPDDWEGEPMDGATYLALGQRENEKRPFVTRVNPPQPVRPAGPIAPPPAPTERERHPVLPRESWVVVFTAHFVAYRASLAARLAESGGGGGIQSEEEEMNGNNSNGSAEQEVLPPANDGLAWRAFVDGTPPPPADEEEAMNSAAEPECPPREPLLRILQRLDTFTTLAILGHLTPTTTLPAHRARWLFALLATLEPHLGSDEMSTLRAFARDVIAFVRERYTAAIYAGELVHVPVRPGFYAGDESDPPQLPAPGVSLERQGWTLGAKCKLKRDALPRSEPARPDGVTGLTPVVDDEISRAWVVILAVIAGWAQRDLVDEYERSLGRLPLP